MPLNADIKAAKQTRLPWWGIVCGIIGSALGAWLFDHLGRLDLARPALYALVILAVVISIKRNLMEHAWFWTSMTGFVALHVVLILFVPWTTKWVPAIVIIPVGIADLYAMLAILSAVEKLLQRPKTSQR